ncbi:hypothetical protein N658DRAFT_151250 [Parathielavia hyrcaniae]|uniref:Secreted protein n=1 Tax=Parathielavia hyrcaniae TaxID=113614 RepID=A0AAN6PXV8_9PEZI|nr:hypothetical protein N658DRAFT_151250 [Parathielavia hyrcaniae]
MHFLCTIIWSMCCTSCSAHGCFCWPHNVVVLPHRHMPVLRRSHLSRYSRQVCTQSSVRVPRAASYVIGKPRPKTAKNMTRQARLLERLGSLLPSNSHARSYYMQEKPSNLSWKLFAGSFLGLVAENVEVLAPTWHLRWGLQRPAKPRVAKILSVNGTIKAKTGFRPQQRLQLAPRQLPRFLSSFPEVSPPGLALCPCSTFES